MLVKNHVRIVIPPCLLNGEFTIDWVVVTMQDRQKSNLTMEGQNHLKITNKFADPNFPL